METRTENFLSKQFFNESQFQSKSNLKNYNASNYIIQTKDPEQDSEWWNYKPLSKFMDMEYFKRNFENVKIIEYNESIYFGDCINSKREGQGIIKYKNNRLYEGSWKNDLRNGLGFELFPNHNKYEGYYLNGKPHGNGVFTWTNGEIYDGQWVNGLKQGNGIWKGINGDSYIGEWKLSKPDGYGVQIWKNGDRYEGEFQLGLKHGQGSEFFSNGDNYLGCYKYGKLYGVGEYTTKQGECYSGQFVNGKRLGFGKWKKSKEPNSNSYEGYFSNDMKHGYGIYQWKSGNEYHGLFRNDERDGIGLMKWLDGSVYLGEWKSGIQNGYGRMLFPDGNKKEGLFINNIFKGIIIKGEQIPHFLQDENFKIESLAPKDFPLESLNKRSLPSVKYLKNKDSQIQSSRAESSVSTKSHKNTIELASFEIHRIGFRNKSRFRKNSSKNSSIINKSSENTKNSSISKLEVRKKYKRLSMAYGINLSPDFTKQNIREKMKKITMHKGKNKVVKELWIPPGIRYDLSNNVQVQKFRNLN